ncbi:MAG: hypothetical protein N2C14_17920, partial [Planctomycetales bacterium]
ASPDAAPDAFAAELGELAETVAQNVQVTLRTHAPAESVEVLHAYPSEPVEGGRVIRLADMIAGECKQVLVKFSFAASQTMGPTTIAQAEIEYDEMTGRFERRRIHAPITLRFMGDSDVDELEPHPEVARCAALLRLAETRRCVSRLLARQDLDGALAALRAAADELIAAGECDAELQAECDVLAEQIESLREAPFTPDPGATIIGHSKTMHHDSHSTTISTGRFRARPPSEDSSDAVDPDDSSIDLDDRDNQ